MFQRSEEISVLLADIEELMKMSGENPFKVRAFEKAQDVVAGRDDLEVRAKAGTLTELEGIGKGIAAVIEEFVKTGASKVRDELRAALPEGLWELTRVSGLGPAKARALIEGLEIRTLGELEYACRENRLVALKGFGEKLQSKILEQLEFIKSTQGQVRLGDIEQIREQIPQGATWVGAFGRGLEIVDAIEVVASASDVQMVEKELHALLKREAITIPLQVSAESGRAWDRIEKTASPEFVEYIRSRPKFQAATKAATESEFFRSLGLPEVPPECREFAEALDPESLLPWDGIQGVFHAHTTASDGGASVYEMAKQAQELGYHYLGVTDHSESAFYAQGLNKAALKKQEKEIKDAQARLPDFRVFWGIESDILADGGLDYDAATLAKFDFVIASVHSRFQMDRKQMTARLVRAVQNPATRFLGHWSGRLLLGRKPYEFDAEKVIEACAKSGVAIEINAHPARLDIDWRYGPELRARGVEVAVNPDAHDLAGLSDTRFGIRVARKMGISKKQVVNARSVSEVERWLKR